MIKPGDRAPDMVLPTPTGETLSLSNMLLTHKSVLIVFLRHLG